MPAPQAARPDVQSMCPVVTPMPGERFTCGGVLPRFVWNVLHDLGGDRDGVEDTPSTVQWLTEETEASAAEVRRALATLCSRGHLEYSEFVYDDDKRPHYVTGWRLTTYPVRPLPGPRMLTDLERRRNKFMCSPERKRLRQEIADGLHACPCGSRDNLHVDHIVPLACGGSNDATNLQVLCGACNMSKGARV